MATEDIIKLLDEVRMAEITASSANTFACTSLMMPTNTTTAV